MQKNVHVYKCRCVLWGSLQFLNPIGFTGTQILLRFHVRLPFRLVIVSCDQIQTTATHTTTGGREVKITAWKNALWLVRPSPITACSQSYISLSYKTLTPSARQAQELDYPYKVTVLHMIVIQVGFSATSTGLGTLEPRRCHSSMPILLGSPRSY